MAIETIAQFSRMHAQTIFPPVADHVHILLNMHERRGRARLMDPNMLFWYFTVFFF
jgi:hypothetical protein